MNLIKQRGFTLTEIILVLIIASVLVISVFIIFKKVQRHEKIRTEISNLINLKGQIDSLFSSLPDYSTLSNSLLIESDLVPKGILYEDSLGKKWMRNSWNGNIIVSQYLSSPIYYSIVYQNIPVDTCSNIISAAQKYFPSIKVTGGATIKKNDSMATISNTCASSGDTYKIMELTFSSFGDW